MLNVKNMTFEEFNEFGEKKTGHKVENDLRRMTNAMKNSRKVS